MAGGAAPLAALLADRDPLRGARGRTCALRLRRSAIRAACRRSPVQAAPPASFAEASALPGSRRGRGAKPADMAALAYPDRIGLRRKGAAPRYVLSGGKGAVLPEGDPLAGSA